MASRKIIIHFPYGGYAKGSKGERAFHDIVDVCRPVDRDQRPILVLNADTDSRGGAATFSSSPVAKELDILRVWSVDTCQMWLAGWGHVLDKYSDVERVAQVPGDLIHIAKPQVFLGNIRLMLTYDAAELVVGDFDTGNAYSAKEMIDTYGTAPLLANWFPDVSRAIQRLSPPLSKVRSEFLNLTTAELRKLLGHRKFAYEQTLAMLIHSWRHQDGRWGCTPTVFQLGTIQDDTSFRSFRGSMDQIERTERLLKLLWREVNEPKPASGEAQESETTQYRDYIDQFESLDRRSRSIRENARIAIRAFLGA